VEGAPVSERRLDAVRRLVVKVGSGLITDGGSGLDPRRIAALADELARLFAAGMEVALVTSGAIVAGMARLGRRDRPRSIPETQAAAAVGQPALMQQYEAAFAPHRRMVAQVLLTRADFSARVRYLNARNTLNTLLASGVLPIINENDTVAVEEIRFGDNDNLSALVAQLIDADLLVLLTDVDGLYRGDPLQDAGATKLDLVEAITPDIEKLCWADAGRIAIGGMSTKLEAAQKAATSGIPMVIANGHRPGELTALLRGEPIGTYFAPRTDRLAARKRWIAFAVAPRGRLVVDAGAQRAVMERGKSLLPSGLVDIEGDFDAGEVVALCGAGGGVAEFARGVVNFDAQELRKIKQVKTSEIERVLGYKSFDEVVHRDNLVVL
jgi:glutamate 5-kinase